MNIIHKLSLNNYKNVIFFKKSVLKQVKTEHSKIDLFFSLDKQENFLFLRFFGILEENR